MFECLDAPAAWRWKPDGSDRHLNSAGRCDSSDSSDSSDQVAGQDSSGHPAQERR